MGDSMLTGDLYEVTPSPASSDSGVSVYSFHCIIDLRCNTPLASPIEPETMSTAAAIPVQMGSPVTDWVQQQACEDNAATNETHASKVEESMETPSVGDRTSRRYDITTLLRLRWKVKMSDVKLQINPDVLQEPIFKRTVFSTLPKASKRSRGLSDVSLNSLHSIPSEEEVIYRKFRPSRQPFDPPQALSEAVQQNFAPRLPRRQPLPPPATALAQHHAGFARFLKEHASPPHQRVTAGGRIVPASGPPPIFNVDSLRALASPSVAPNSLAAPKEIDPGPATQELATQNDMAMSDAVAPANPQNTARAVGTAKQRQTVAAFAENMRQIGIQEAEKQHMQLGPAGTASTMNMSFALPDGSRVLLQNGLPYRVYWNGVQNVAEPLNVQPGLMPGSTAANVQKAGPSAQYSVANPNAAPPTLPMVISNLSSVQNPHSTHFDQGVPDHVLQRQHENLRYELKKLDKHIALRSQTFSSAEHANHVAQRKHLVEQIDNIRVMRGRRERTSTDATNALGSYANLQDPMYSYKQIYQNVIQGPHMTANAGPGGSHSGMNNQMLAIGPPWDALINGTPQVVATTNPNVPSHQQTPSVKVDSAASKVLSPEAPPFVPSSMQGNQARKIENCLPHDQQKNDPKTTNGSLSTAAAASSDGKPASSHTYGNVAKASTGEKDQDRPDKEIHSHSRLATSGSWSAMDDVVPVVHQSDIAYVDDLGLNPVQDAKLYCSTVTEFQEVIRRVREQARLYGCEGGQSKDPEFDAEQDIRWAMADSSPVPLPRKMPDHIANPRPWNWNDSAFNVRADRSHLKLVKKSDLSKSPENLKGAPSASIETKPASGNVGALSDQGSLNLSTDAARRSANPDSSDDSDPFGDSKQVNSSEGTRTVLGELPINSRITDPSAESAATVHSSVGSRTPSQKEISDDTVTQHAFLEVPNAETSLKEKLSKDHQQGAASGKSTELGRRPYHAYVEDEKDSPSEPSVPAVIITNTAAQDKEAVKQPEALKYPMVNGKKNGWDMTIEELDADIAANPQPWALPPPPPDSPGWEDYPDPLQIRSKMPFKIEDVQRSAVSKLIKYMLILMTIRGLRGDPPVHMPNIHGPQNPNAGPSKPQVLAGGAKPFGYNEHKPISIPSRPGASGTPSFLRDMLKNPRFSTTNLGQQLPAGSMGSRNAAFATSSRHTTDKENFNNNMLAGSRANQTNNPIGSRLPSSNNLAFSTQDARIGKAQSSIASSSHYAQGYLPQNPRNVQQPFNHSVRWHIPQVYGHTQNGYTQNGYHISSGPGYGPPSRPRYPPQYDGPGESSPPSRARSGHMVNGVGQMVNGVNKGNGKVTTQDFEVTAADVPSSHGRAVDAYFRNVSEADRNEVNSSEQRAPNGL
ncbi:MAG: hypothetical protein Q9191_004411 [Dirinaria sp. TL-2023a]